MKIGIISDTHIKKINHSFFYKFDTYFAEVDFIIHAGDYIDEEVIKKLKDYKKFIGVWGNVDNNKIKELVQEKEIISVDGYKIGVVHGHGTKKTTLDRAYETFKEDAVDIIIFGHSHQPVLKTKNNILMVNPGSLTNKRRERWFSYAILKINGEDISLEFKFV